MVGLFKESSAVASNPVHAAPKIPSPTITGKEEKEKFRVGR